MKKKDIEKIKSKSVAELTAHEKKLRTEITDISLNLSINPPKDMNIVAKKKQELATVLHIKREKEVREPLKV